MYRTVKPDVKYVVSGRVQQNIFNLCYVVLHFHCYCLFGENTFIYVLVCIYYITTIYISPTFKS